MAHDLESLVIRRTCRIPRPAGPAGQGTTAIRQFDAALASVGLKLSPELLDRLSGLSGSAVVRIATRTLRTVGEMVGDDVRHNAYFIDFPAHVPDTGEFWARCVRTAHGLDTSREHLRAQVSRGELALLSLPEYGRYQRTYEELLADTCSTAAANSPWPRTVRASSTAVIDSAPAFPGHRPTSARHR